MREPEFGISDVQTPTPFFMSKQLINSRGGPTAHLPSWRTKSTTSNSKIVANSSNRQQKPPCLFSAQSFFQAHLCFPKPQMRQPPAAMIAKAHVVAIATPHATQVAALNAKVVATTLLSANTRNGVSIDISLIPLSIGANIYGHTIHDNHSNQCNLQTTP